MNNVAELEAPNRVQRMSFVSFGDDKPAAKPEQKVAAPEEVKVEAPPPEQVVPAITEDDLHRAKADGRTEGYKEGITAAEAKINAEVAKREEATKAALESIANQIMAAAQVHAAEIASMQDAMNKTVVAAARKIAGDALKAEPYTGVEALVRECAALITGTTKVAITVPPALAAGLKQRIDALRPQLGSFGGELIVEENAELKDTDCRVQWKNGFAERDTAKLWSDIENIISRARTT